MGYNVQQTLDAAALLGRVAGAAMQDFSRLVHLCHYALETQHIAGDIVEFGCFRGDTAKLLSAITRKDVHLFDSFAGLPDNGEPCVPGAMRTTIDAVRNNFAQDDIRQPHIHPGWFSDLIPADLPERIAFAHLDGDLYASTMAALKLVYPRMSVGGVILVDDYGEPYFTGPEQACDVFFADKEENVIALNGMNGVRAYKALITKL